MDKTVIIRSNRLNLIPKEMKCKNMTVEYMFADLGKVSYWIKEFCVFFKLRVFEKYYNPKLKNLDADTIIVFDGHVRIQFLEWLKKNNPNKRIILWCWNTVQEIGDKIPMDKIPAGIEKWSYSKFDCKKYNLHYNTTFYPTNYEMPNFKIERDVFFVGKDKGRLAELVFLQNQLEVLGLSTYFHISPTYRFWLKKNKCYSSPIPYKKVLEEIAKSKAILDFSVSKTAGPTIRPLESLFHKRKLITDDLNIISCDYYCPNNIFVLGKDDIQKIPEFLNSPYTEINTEIVNKYGMGNWLQRFFS
jgi:hypothetical protein